MLRMNCHEHEAELVDLARGIEPDAATHARLRTHLDGCAACAARLAREQALTAELKHLADATPAPAPSASAETRLLQAFAARHAGARASAPAPARREALSHWWLAAATVVLATGAWLATQPWRGAGDRVSSGTPAVVVPAGPARASTAQPSGAPAAPRSATALRSVPEPRRPIPARRQVARRSTPAGGEDDVLRFVTLPSAEDLPVLESGRIVRLELPMAFLPAYGIDVPPEDASRVVEADVLVGQDGQPRAIRFVGPETDQRRRQ
jgi:hypothetical protein